MVDLFFAHHLILGGKLDFFIINLDFFLDCKFGPDLDYFEINFGLFSS